MAIETTNTISTAQAAADGAEAVEKNRPKKRDQSYWKLVRRQYRKNKLAMAALYFILLMFAVAIFADFIANDKPILCSYKGSVYAPVLKDYLVDLGISSYSKDLVNADWKSLNYDWKIFPPIKYTGNGTDLASSFGHPFESGSDHYLGTDQVGHDVLAGLIHGSRISLSIGFVSMGLAAIIGIILGALAGYFGGWTDIMISRLIELFLNFPTFFLIIVIVSFFDANIWLVMLVIGVTGWMGIARLVRGEILRVRNMEYVTAANSLGFGASRIIFRHVLPNSLAPVLVAIAFGIAGAILLESSLSFLGFGVPATIVTWGSALNQATTNMAAWWMAVFPGLMIFLTVVSYNLIGDGLRDATDPRLKT